MGLYKIDKGLDLPITGRPEQIISEGNVPKSVAILGDDYVGLKPTMAVSVGDHVKLGQVLFIDKKMPLVKFTSPGAGKVVAINRGERRHFLSIVINLEGSDEVSFKSFKEGQIGALKREEIVHQLLESGLWTSLRSRPFSKVANPEINPYSIFITAMDTNPNAPSMEKIIEGRKKDLILGLKILAKLTEGQLFLCKAPNADIPGEEVESVSVEEFSGPHPAGNVGTHIHFLDPVSKDKTVWYINAQDVIAMGILFSSGKLKVDRVVSLAGPSVKSPRLIRTRIGASLEDVTENELKEGQNRVISGPLLSGHTATGPKGFLGRYHQQVAVIPEEREKYFLGWLRPGFNFYSLKKLFISAFFPRKKYNFNTLMYGSERAIIPIGAYEKVMPLDIEPTFLFRALAVDDIEEAEKLGCLELDEEDVALCSFACTSKINHGANLRRVLNLIEKEG